MADAGYVTELLKNISDLTEANLTHLNNCRQLQTENKALSNKLYATTYKLADTMKSVDLYQQATSTLYTNVNIIHSAKTLPECMEAIRGSVKSIFKLDGITLYYRTLGGRYSSSGLIKLSEFFNNELGDGYYTNGRELIDRMYKLNNLTMTQCNIEQLQFIHQTGKNVYTSVILTDNEPIFAGIIDRKTPITLHEMQLLDFLLKSYAVIIQFKRNIMESTIIANTLMNKYGHAVQSSMIDNLTKVYNSKALSEKLETTLKNTSYCIVFFDLDNFKYVNDTFSHDAGDSVLVWFAHQLKLFAEELGGDAFRYGGDEFIATFVGSSELTNLVTSNLEIFIQAVREKVFVFNTLEEDDKPSEEVSHSITVSIGVYYNENKTPFNEAKAKADEALYKSKRSGKNTITVVED